MKNRNTSPWAAMVLFGALVMMGCNQLDGKLTNGMFDSTNTGGTYGEEAAPNNPASVGDSENINREEDREPAKTPLEQFKGLMEEYKSKSLEFGYLETVVVILQKLIPYGKNEAVKNINEGAETLFQGEETMPIELTILIADFGEPFLPSSLCNEAVKEFLHTAKDNSRGYTLLHIAAQLSDTAIGEILVNAGANKDAKDNNGWVPLHLATLYDKVAACELLLKAGANKDAKDNNGRTPLDKATKNSEVYKLLRKHGAKHKFELYTHRD